MLEGSDTHGRGEGESKGRWATWKEREPELGSSHGVAGGDEPQEGQGSQLLRELAKIELQASVGSDLAARISNHLAALSLDSPGNLRLVRTLLNARLLDECDEHGMPSDPCLEITNPEDGSWIMDEAEDSGAIMELWGLLYEAEEMTRHGRAGQPTVWGAGRALAVEEIGRWFTWLEVYLGSYKIEHQVEGVRRIAEVIVARESDPEE